MGGSRIVGIVLIALLGGALVGAPSAEATFHEMSIREVYPGSAAHPDSGYVELQMYAAGQNLVGGHALTVYNAAGAAIGTFTFPANVANAADQQTILIGDSGVQGAFGVAPDLTDSGLEVRAGGGAACWAGTIDCVSWGNFAGSTPSPAGKPADASGIPDGKALRRTIEPSCPTRLDAVDDSNDSATDLLDATPAPRSNSSPIVESACTGPSTTIDSKPANPTKATSASFAFHSVPPAASFECKLDTGSFVACSSGMIEYPGPLVEGTHAFQVRAKDAGDHFGVAATYGWRVDITAPTVTIDSHPADPSRGDSAAFAYHASESGASFECSLAAGAAPATFSPCASSGKAYANLADGEYSFEVRAKDAAANQGNPVAFAWTVDNSLADTTPPQTTILSKPTNPSDSSTVSFKYASSEPGSHFECAMDSAALSSCPAEGVTYSGLANGLHSFRVRAIDSSGNADSSPAGYSFDVEAIPSSPPATPAPTSTAPPALMPTPRPMAKPPPRRHRHKVCRRGRHPHGKRCHRGGRHAHPRHHKSSPR